MEKKLKKDVKKPGKTKSKTTTETNSKRKSKTKSKNEVKKVTKKDTKKEKKKKEESYFIALLKSSDLIFASWKIDIPVWIKRIQTAEKDLSGKQYLFIDISSIENSKYNKIDRIPVNGLENNWHIFIKNEYCGKRVVFSLSYCDKKGKDSDILISEAVDIPYSIDYIESNKNKLHEENILLEISGIKSAGISGSDNTSW